ncbi:MAG: IclR family transcriptional regulator [Lautropia sp.]
MPPRRHGTQSLERAALLLRELAAREQFGWRLRDLAQRCGLEHATAHRMLQCLVRERLVRQRPGDRHYLPGPLLFELGLGLSAHGGFQAACRPVVNRLSRQHAALAVAYLRSGSEFVCLARAGPSVYLGTALAVGTRRPMMTTAGGVAMLISMPPAEAAAIVAHNLRQLQVMGGAVTRRLETFYRRSLALGYAFNRGETTRDVHSLGVPVRDANGAAFAAVVVAGRAEDFPEARVAAVVERLRAEAELLEREARRLELDAVLPDRAEAPRPG